MKASTLKELIEFAKREARPPHLGSPGTATPQHLAGEDSSSSRPAGSTSSMFPYRGGGQLIGDLVGGQIPLGLIGLPPTLPHIRAGKLKVFAVTARKRSPSLPDVPTVEEAGLPGYETVQWLRPAAPAGTPARSSSACTPSSTSAAPPDGSRAPDQGRLEVAPRNRRTPTLASYGRNTTAGPPS